MSAPEPRRAVGYLLRSYPRLSQTFVLHEILALERIGVRLWLLPIENPREPVTQAQVAEVRAPVQYLETVARQPRAATAAAHLRAARAAPRRYAATLAYLLRNRAIDAGYTASSRMECLHQAVHLAGQLRRPDNPIGHLHAHFAHDPTLIAQLTHMLTGISYSFTAHARDLVQIPRAALVDRVAAASTVITCCAANMEYLDQVLPPSQRHKARLIYHGVNLDGFHPSTENQELRTEQDGESNDSRFLVPGSVPQILSVGRLVEKKGFPDLVRACGLLRRAGLRFRCTICGEGPLRAELAALIAELELADIVSLAGERPQRELIPIFQQADIFALTPFVTDDGDRDGVPNVLVEAMACGLPVVSTRVAGIPELVRHEHNGLLAAPRDVEELAAQLGRLIREPGARAQMGAAARATVVEHFDIRSAARQIAGLFEAAMGADMYTNRHPQLAQ